MVALMNGLGQLVGVVRVLRTALSIRKAALACPPLDISGKSSTKTFLSSSPQNGADERSAHALKGY